MKVIVNKPFTLIRDDGTEAPFVAGLCEMAKEDFDHWYTQLHAEATKVVKPKPDETVPTAAPTEVK